VTLVVYMVEHTGARSTAVEDIVRENPATGSQNETLANSTQFDSV